MKIATSNYTIAKFNDVASYQKKITTLVEKAKANQADLLLLPEYAGVEIACGNHKTDADVFSACEEKAGDFIDFFTQLSQKYNLYIQPGTILVKKDEKQFYNRAYFFSPEGSVGYQDKLQLTTYEKSSQLIARGATQTIFQTQFGKIGIAICYDSEFPEIVRNLVFAGCDLILVPSYTSSIAGYYRVFLSARARALENQCYVATAFVVGTVASGDGIDHTHGQAAILGPVDVSFPDDGIIAQLTANTVDLLFADISFEKLQRVRKKGSVQNYQDSINQKKLGEPACLVC